LGEVIPARQKFANSIIICAILA